MSFLINAVLTYPFARNPTTPSVSTFERPNRLKPREDPGIKWNELLEKFRSTQEKGRRSQHRSQSSTSTAVSGITFADATERTVSRTIPEPTGRQAPKVNSGIRPGSPASLTRPQVATIQQGHTKGRSSLSNLGRFASRTNKAKK